MPEGHTIHRVARDHSKWYLKQKLVVSSPQGRFEEADQLNGKRIQRVEAHGKHLFYTWTGGQTLHIHLGLYGKFRRHKSPPPEPRGAVRLRVVGKERSFDLNGPTACELLTKEQRQAIHNRLGADPLRDDADVEKAWNRIHRSKVAIGKILLNQAIIAGVGNVYRAEALYVNQLHPERSGNSLSRETFDQLWDTLVEMLNMGVKYNRIITADPREVGKPPSRMKKDERLLCYKKEFCGYCDSSIESWSLASRTMYACPKCQS